MYLEVQFKNKNYDEKKMFLKKLHRRGYIILIIIILHTRLQLQ